MPKDRSRRATIAVAVIDAAAAWRALLPDAATRARRAARAALRGRLDGPAALNVLLADNRTLRRLNRDWRGKDKPTNVLSFPDGAPDEDDRLGLGDVALAAETVAREATHQGKSVGDHFSHLVVHGVLHLIGYNHEQDDEAEIMEAVERRVLARLGVADPYAVPRLKPR